MIGRIRALVLPTVSLVLLAVVVFILVNYQQWFLAHPIDELSRYRSAPKPPSGAVSFAVDHGRFVFFDDSPSTNSFKTILLAVILAGSSFVLLIWGCINILRYGHASGNKSPDRQSLSL